MKFDCCCEGGYVSEYIELVVDSRPSCNLGSCRDGGFLFVVIWNEIYRILKVGGRFVVSDIYATTAIPDEYRNDPVAIAECWAGAVTRQEYMHTLDCAGFEMVEVIEESMPYQKGKAQVASFTIRGVRTEILSEGSLL